MRAEPRLWWGALVASWFWLVGALVLSLLPPLVTFDIGGTEEVVTLFLTIFSVAVAVGSGLAAWLAARAHRSVADADRRACCSACSALDLGWTDFGRRAGDHPLGVGELFLLAATASTSPSISPGSRSPAACSSCRPSPRCRPGPAPITAPASSPPSTCSMPPSWSSAPSCSPCCRSSASASPLLFALHRRRQPRRRRRHRPHHAGELAERFSLDRLPRLLPSRGQGPGERRQGRPQRHHRAQPCELPRCAAGDVAPAQAAGLRHRRGDLASTGGSSRSCRSCAPWRSIRSSRWRCAPSSMRCATATCW